MEKSQYEESCSLDTYRVDRNEIGKPSGLWQLMQEAASNQMATQKPSYTDLVDAGKALMLARVDLAIPEQIGLKEALISSSCINSRTFALRAISSGVFSSWHSKTSKLCIFIIQLFGGLHNLWRRLE